MEPLLRGIHKLNRKSRLDPGKLKENMVQKGNTQVRSSQGQRVDRPKREGVFRAQWF